jgi:hypothetical protein
MAKLAEKSAEKAEVQPVNAVLAVEVEQLPVGPNREQIELRAYEIYVQRGSVDGNDLADWLEAENELLAQAALLVPIAKAAAA